VLEARTSAEHKDLSLLEKIFAYQFIPTSADNMVEAYDRNFVQASFGLDPSHRLTAEQLPKQEMLNMNIRWEKIPMDGGDIAAWREFDDTEYFTYDRAVQCKRMRQEVEVVAANVSVSYGEKETFGIRVFEPQGEVEGLRPAIIMYHGGGWSHGSPRNDEGKTYRGDVFKRRQSYPPSALVRRSQMIITITLYRLFDVFRERTAGRRLRRRLPTCPGAQRPHHPRGCVPSGELGR
jgi:hypothetical protein